MITRLNLAVHLTTLIFLFSFLTASIASAGNVTYEFDADRLIFSIHFEKGYSGVDAFKNGNEVIIAFETTEEIVFEKQSFFDLPIQNAWLISEGTRKKLYFTFNGPLIDPTITKQAKSITIAFPLPPSTLTGNVPPPPPPAIPGAGAYIRMLFGLAVIVAFILVAYGIMKIFFKHNMVTDIPGSGRLLGKVDLAVKKSLLFYELGEIIYILGVTDHGINLIDKITDPVDINVIKAGFSRKKDFSSYLKFFKKGNDLKEDMEDSSTLLKEKLSSLRKK